jgi:serine/threonine protein kinase
MSPEQVEGLAVDGRSDVFSLGAVLSEMVTGARAFDGETVMDVIAAVLRGPPRMHALGKLEPVIGRALDKLPAPILPRWRHSGTRSARFGASSSFQGWPVGTAVSVPPPS